MPSIWILGGDGYLGWPTAMHFSNRGYQVTVIDNYFRRSSCKSLDLGMLYSVPNLVDRAKIWYEKTGYEIKVVITDLSDPIEFRKLFDGEMKSHWFLSDPCINTPETIIHYAEQPSAPYSVLDHKHADTTLINNLRVTHNLVWLVKEFSPDIHIIKLGTMGEYGTPNIDIEEGWLNISHNGRSDKFLYPRQANSIYHTSKIMDTDLMWYAVRIWGLKVTDLMQGPVYGIETDETILDNRLRTIFNYDEIFGTVLNRFIVQAVCNHPLTIYGSGNQARGYINIRDTLQCVHASELNPAKTSELRIFNQITEVFKVNQLVNMVKKVGKSRGYKVSIENIKNPRNESEEHYYNPSYQGLKDIGVSPNILTEDVLHKFFEIVEEHKKDIRKDVIFKGIKW